MITRFIARYSTLALALCASATTALAQRPPAPGQGPPQFSIERAWTWLMARPGVIVALVVIVIAVAYMVVTRRKSRT